MNLAIVYLGKNIPKYVFRNLTYLKSTFPMEAVYFISDNEAALQEASRIGVEKFKASRFEENSRKLESQLSHPMGFRDQFWLHTTSRFFAILEFSHFLNAPFLQIEADVFLFKSFPFSKFEQIREIAFPLETSRTGAASIFYVPNSREIAEFVSFILEMTNLNSLETDMTLLGKYWTRYPQKVAILPSMTITRPLSKVDDAQSASMKNFDYFQGVFDPLTYGMHLLGEDPMNSRGLIRFGKKPDNHLISSMKLKFELRDNSLFLIQDETSHEIFCLHVHSKNLNMFDPRKYLREIKRGIKLSSRSGTRLSPRAFLKLVKNFLNRRFVRSH
jgi:hypothetical protein